jgi:hypothetical protein
MTGSIRLRVAGPAVVLGLAAITTAGTACVSISAEQYVDREEKRFAVSGKPDVSLSTFDGSIEIRSADRQEVAVTIEKRSYSKEGAARIDVHTEQNANHVVVDVRLPKESHVFGIGWMNTSARLIVTLPAASNVQARSGDGSIDIERVSGTIELRSGDGSIQGRQLAGDLKAHTGDGSVKLADVSGALDVDTGDGSISVDGKLTSVRARTGDGSVTIRAASGSAVEADWNITTGDGSVILEVPEGFSGELDAHTGDGRVTMHEIALNNVTGPIGKNSARGRLGSGGHAVRVRTGDGSITLRRF